MKYLLTIGVTLGLLISGLMAQEPEGEPGVARSTVVFGKIAPIGNGAPGVFHVVVKDANGTTLGYTSGTLNPTDSTSYDLCSDPWWDSAPYPWSVCCDVYDGISGPFCKTVYITSNDLATTYCTPSKKAYRRSFGSWTTSCTCPQ